MSDLLSATDSTVGEGWSASPEEIIAWIDALNEQAYVLRSTDLARATELCDQALAEARRLGYTRGIAAGTLNRGIFETYASRNDVAFRLFLEAQHLFESVGARQGLASALRWVGVMYTRIGGNIVALEYFLRSRAIGEELGDNAHVAICLINIGGAHSALGDHHKALECFSQALDMQSYGGKPLEKAMLLWNAGRAYEGLGNLDKAASCYTESLELRRTTGDATGSAAALFAYGDIERKRKNYAHALRCYLTALHWCEQASFLWGCALCNHGIGALYGECNRLDRAQEYLVLALRQAEQMQTRETMYNVHRELAACFRKLGDAERAYDHLSRFHTIREELSVDQVRHTVAYVRYGHEAEMARREAEIYKMKNGELADAYARLSDAFEEVKVLNNNLSLANERLTELNNEKNEVLGIVSHDLKNPLTSILLSTSMLRRYFDREIPAPALREIERIEDTAVRMKEAVTRLLDSNAVETGAVELRAEQCDVVAVVALVAEEYRHSASIKRIALHLEPAVPEVIAYADRTAVYSVLDNLISNAVKFSPHGRGVHVRMFYAPSAEGADGQHSGTTQRRACVEVRDEGPGIDEQEQERLFRRFARLSARPTGGEHSTGLGLSIVHRLVTEMGGTVYCKSKAGEGASFVVELPAPA